MAHRKIIVSSAGGIAPGAPFVLHSFLQVEQAAPPVANTTRMAQLTDSELSIVAPGAAGAARNLVLGRAVIDSTDSVDSVLLGDNIQTTQSGTDDSQQVLVGATITLPTDGINSNFITALGSKIGLSYTGAVYKSFDSNVAVGSNITITATNADGDAANNVVIGDSIAVYGGINVCIGAGSGIPSGASESVVVGSDAQAVGPQSVSVGYNANGGDNGVAVGDRSRADQHGVGIGSGAQGKGGGDSVAIGYQAEALASGAMAFGSGTQHSTPNLALFGSAGFPITTLRLGGGVNAATGGTVFTFGTTEVYTGGNANTEGFGVQLRAGAGTGDWANTENLGLELQVGEVGGSGTTQQTYTSPLAIRHSDLNIALWGGLAAGFQGGAGVLFVANAVTPPTGAVTGGVILYASGGSLYCLNGAGVAVLLA